MFCKKCGTVLVQGLDRCVNCSALVKTQNEIREPVQKKGPTNSTAYSEDIETREVIKEQCRKCDNDQCFVVRVQIFPTDEAETIIYQCTKCKYKWRLN